MTAPRIGFRRFGDTDADIVFQDSLTSISQMSVGGGETPDYSEDGVLLPNDDCSLYKNNFTAEEKAALAISGSISMEINNHAGIGESADDSYLATGNQYFFNIGTSFGLYIAGGSRQINWFGGSGANPSSIDTRRSGSNANGKNLWTFSWHGSTLTLLLNDFSISTIQHIITEELWNTGFFLGRLTTVQDAFTGARYKNLIISTQPVVLPVPQQLISLCTFGDSRDNGGTYANVQQLILDSAGGGYGDGRAMPNLHRAINKYGFDIGQGQAMTFGAGGSKISDIPSQIVTATSEQQHHIQTAIVHTGLNDVISGAITATHKTGLQTIVDDLKAKGCDLILMVNCTSPTSNQTLYSSNATYDPRVNQLNTYFNEIDDENLEAQVVDFWSLTGGNSPKPDYFGADPETLQDIHPSAKAYSELGRILLFDALEPSLF